jgi:hypothetical protein
LAGDQCADACSGQTKGHRAARIPALVVTLHPRSSPCCRPRPNSDGTMGLRHTWVRLGAKLSFKRTWGRAATPIM